MAEREKKELTFEFDFDDTSFRQARLTVMGVGGGGCNAVNTMFTEPIEQITYVVANTDVQALEDSPVPNKLQLGAQLTKGLGAGGNPNVGREAAIESKDAIADVVRGADMLFITAGMGGGTGTGAAPVVAQIARELDVLTVAVVTRPFDFEGEARARVAAQGIEMLSELVNTLIVIPNDRLLDIAGDLPWIECFKKADEVLANAVQGISDLITRSGYVNVDFADVKAVMSNSGYALMGTGIASGENRAIVATQQAIESPLLDDISIHGAKGVLINISGPRDVRMNEVREAVNYVTEAAGKDAQIIFGLIIDDSLEDAMKVTVIATGFDKKTQENTTARRVRRQLPEQELERRPRLDAASFEIPALIRRQGKEETEADEKVRVPANTNTSSTSTSSTSQGEAPRGYRMDAAPMDTSPRPRPPEEPPTVRNRMSEVSSAVSYDTPIEPATITFKRRL